MVKESLLSKITMPDENVHRMAGEKKPEMAAREYAEELKKFFGVTGGILPRFDLMLLGLGEDGHTASLFPGSSALNETRHLVVTTYVEKLNAHRLTLTFPVINNAAQITFLVAGQSKATVAKEILAGPKSDAPAARIKAGDGKLSWFISQDAARDLGIS